MLEEQLNTHSMNPKIWLCNNVRINEDPYLLLAPKISQKTTSKRPGFIFLFLSLFD